MGGEFDATNVIEEPIGVIITPVGAFSGPEISGLSDSVGLIGIAGTENGIPRRNRATTPPVAAMGMLM